jgi:single-strand DNA-binding protein
MTEASVSFAGNLTDDPELGHTEGGIARAMFRVAVSGRREQEASFFTVVVWRGQAEHAAESLSKGSRVVVVGRLQQRSWTAEDGGARSIVEVVAEELGPSLRWATAATTRATRSVLPSTATARRRWPGRPRSSSHAPITAASRSGSTRARVRRIVVSAGTSQRPGPPSGREYRGVHRARRGSVGGCRPPTRRSW